MRRMLSVLLLCLAPGIASADAILVDANARRVETSKLIVRFNAICPERVDSLVYKDYGAANLRGDWDPWEFHGQSILRLWSGQGFIWPQSMVNQSWTVLHQTPTILVVRIESTSVDQPPVRTDYTFYADAPYYRIDRTVYFTVVPVTSSFQPYVARMHPCNVFATARYRDTGGAVIQTGYYPTGRVHTDWDRRWAENCGPGIGVTVMNASTNPQLEGLVDDYDGNSYSSWLAPILIERLYNTDTSVRLLITFSTTPDDLAWLDQVYAWFDAPVSAVRTAPEILSGPSLSILPDPEAGLTRICFDLPFETPARMALYDVGGRQVARLLDGRLPAGPHLVSWSGHGEDGRPVAPGVYWVRLTGEFGSSTGKLLWVR